MNMQPMTARNRPGAARASGTPRVDFLVVAQMVEGGAKVLDVGCGDGELLKILAETKSDKAWQDAVKRVGSVPSIWSASDTMKFLKESLDKIKAVVKEIGIKL